MVGLLGALSVKVSAMGVAEASKKLKALSEGFSKMSKSMKPQLQKLTAGFKKFGLVAGGAMSLLIASSPLLRAKMEVLNIRIQELVRSFEDALVPALEFVTELVEEAITWWESLPEPLQQAIIFGMQVAVMLGIVALGFMAVNVAMSPITLIILGIIAAAALLYLVWTTNFLGIQEITAAVFGFIGKIIGAIITIFTSFGTFVSELFSYIGEIIGAIITIFTSFGTFVSELFSYIGEIIGGLIGVITGLWETVETVLGWIGAGFGSWFDGIEAIIGNVIGIFEGLIDFVVSIFKGDLSGALDAIEDVFKNAFQAMEKWIMLPLTFVQGLIKGITGKDIIGDILDAGKKFIGAFIKGAEKAIKDAGRVLTDILDLIGDFLGGSLPEKGPLRHVVKWGEELGESYVLSIGSGLSSNISTIDNSLSIDRLEMAVTGADMERSEDLFGELDSLRGSRAW